jgi:N-methylhydantoinase A/oxoprolinase/acetone carboxylase beta subunit
VRFVNLNSYGVGISTGGSFTDAVVMELSSWKVIAKAKSRTTYEDFSVGIINSLDKVLDASKVPNEQVELVSLATTLATNAIIEGRGEKVGLILIGMSPSELQGIKPHYASDLPVRSIASIRGGYGPDGVETVALDTGELHKAINDMANEVDAFAVSGLFSVRNPQQEVTVKREIQRLCSKPVVCGYELAGELGIYERTVTAVLNARIIPIIERLIKDVKNALSQRGIFAPLMLVRGDGALMNEAFARERAIETVQSGPAASVIGGKFLSSKENAVVMDIGSTTTIIASIKDGSVKTDDAGVTVMGWKTRVKAVDADAIANGGDSWICVELGPGIEPEPELKIGPKRVIPLAFASKDFPTLKEKMLKTGTSDFFASSKAMKKHDGSGIMGRVVDAVKALEPVSLQELKKDLPDIPTVELLAGMLENSGHLARIGLTPTDLMHIKKLFTAGDADASTIGADIIAERMKVTPDLLFDRVWDTMAHRIALHVVERRFEGDNGERISADIKKAHRDVLDRLVAGSIGEMKVACTLDVPVVGIGAPANMFIPQVGKKLGTQHFVPENHEVGAAIGALVGNVVISMTLQVRKEIKPEQYVVFPGRHIHDNADAAANHAIKIGKGETAQLAKRAGAMEIDFKIERKDRVFPGVGFMWSDIKVTAAGKPMLGKKAIK